MSNFIDKLYRQEVNVNGKREFLLWLFRIWEKELGDLEI